MVDKLEGSALDLGIVTSGSGAPILALSLFGGVVSDRFPKRTLLAVTQTCNGIIALLVAILVITDLVQIWHMIIAAVLSGTVFAFNMPGRQSLIPELVSKEKLSNAVALNSVGMNLNRIIAPGLGGILVALIGLGGVYLVITACYAFAAVSMLMVHAPQCLPAPSLILHPPGSQGWPQLRQERPPHIQPSAPGSRPPPVRSALPGPSPGFRQEHIGRRVGWLRIPHGGRGRRSGGWHPRPGFPLQC